MRKGGGKSKGNRFENKVSRLISLWLTGGKDKTQLISSRQSGGWGMKGGEKQAWRHVGDIAPNGPLGEDFRKHFAVECKDHKEITFWHVWTAQPGENLLGWWLTLRGEIEREIPEAVAPAPLLIYKQAYKPIMIATEVNVLDPVWSREEQPHSLIITGAGERFATLPFEEFIQVPAEEYFQCVRP